MAEPQMTEKQVERDKFLHRLAARPGEALLYWKRLRRGEDLVVVTYMTLYYGVLFAQYFFQQVRRARNRPLENVIFVTNMETPQQVQAQGFQHFGDVGGVDIWVSPFGNEIWLLPPPRVPPPPLPEHPAVTEARGYADSFTAQFEQLRQLSQQLKNHVGMADYSTLYQNLLDAYNKWNQDAAWHRDTVFPDLKAETVEPSETAGVEKQQQRLEELQSRAGELFRGEDSKGGYALTPSGKDYY